MKAGLYDESITMTMSSEDPYQDLRASMEEMVVAHELKQCHITTSDRPRSSLSIEPGFGQCSGISPKFTWRFAEGIGKLTGNMPGDRQKKTRRLTVRVLEAAGLAGVADDS
ncbi:hypothetical protein B296_00006960 [Ensete ventricosum]|uniref:OVATE domain-containing protein n=1 Tax=Ensete ventricosum TaxID=4639 RepID=A0A427ATY2_ENSVE|nr:hypothetical protein B296_00006960 [Ensete ventricosum]